MGFNELLPPQIREAEPEPDTLLQATLDFEQAARHLDLETWITQRLRTCEREITTHITTSAEAAAGLRVQHHTGGRPTIGPVHLREAGLHEIKAAAMQQTWQLALMEAPFGGSAGAIVCNPEQLAENDLRVLAGAYARSLRGTITSHSDILAPGEGCNQQTMAWLLEHNRELWDMAAIVGKPEVLWGVAGFYDAVPLGIVSLLEEALGGLKDKRISIQGFGATGNALARLLHERGARIIALADSSGGLYKPAGIDIPALLAHFGEKTVLYGFAGAEDVCNADVLEADCDALLLTAAPRQINAANVERIRAPLLLEATLGAITSAAEEQLADRMIVPHLLATAGAALAAEVEWLRSANPTLSVRALGEVIEDRIRTAWRKLCSFQQSHELSLRQAALVMAVDRVAAQMRLSGE